jgi:hypothetical protein
MRGSVAEIEEVLRHARATQEANSRSGGPGIGELIRRSRSVPSVDLALQFFGQHLKVQSKLGEQLALCFIRRQLADELALGGIPLKPLEVTSMSRKVTSTHKRLRIATRAAASRDWISEWRSWIAAWPRTSGSVSYSPLIGCS